MGVVVLHPSTHHSSAQSLLRLWFSVTLARAQRIGGLVTFILPSMRGWGPDSYTGESVMPKPGNVPMELSALE